jgi:hypothetical protein
MALAKLPSTAAFGRRAAGDVAAEDGCSRSGSAHVFVKYIQPCSPVTAKTVPAGDDWQHEIKFDGFAGPQAYRNACGDRRRRLSFPGRSTSLCSMTPSMTELGALEGQ